MRRFKVRVLVGTQIQVDMEDLKEGWVGFSRLHCLDGYIDIFQGNAGVDPKRESKRQVSLNLIVYWIRFQGEDWTQDYKRGAKRDIKDFHTIATLQELKDLVLNTGIEVSLQN